MTDKIYSLKCTGCQTQTAFSFVPFPDNLPPVYCADCTKMIMQFPTKYGVDRFNNADVKTPWDKIHRHALSKFLTSDYYEKNKGQPNVTTLLETPIKPE